MMKGLVVKARKTDYPNPIRVSKGEMVECLEESNESGDWKGWIFCRTIDNEGGIPQQIIARNNNRGNYIGKL